MSFTRCEASEVGDICDDSECTSCCPHDEKDHGICLDCGFESDPGEDIDDVVDYLDQDR